MNFKLDRAVVKILTGPTRLRPLLALEKRYSVQNLFIKDDHEIFDEVGGNKARKMEFILGEFLKAPGRELVTFGAYGSNHVLTTALCAKKFGFKLRAHLSPQPITDDVKNKLLTLHALGVELHGHSSSFGLALQVLRNKKHPGYIHPGASSVTGSLGYVNAAFELVEQLKEKGLDQKKIEIVLPAGSLGTVSGLIAGFVLAKFHKNVKIVAVQVVPLHWNLGQFGITRLAKKILKTFNVEFDDFDSIIDFRPFHYRPGYGKSNEKVLSAIKSAKEIENIDLDVTYSGKAFSVFLESIQNQSNQDSNVARIFWNTYPKYNLEQYFKGVHYKKLPREFHFIFET